jgi:rare lipoprotein A
MTRDSDRKKESLPSWRVCFFLALCLCFTGCQTRMLIETSPERKETQIYSPKPTLVEYGTASWYGGRWIGRLTANGETYRAGDITAAHKKLPFNTSVRVVDLKTGNSVIVRINNRGPFVRGRIIDLSVAAAKKLGTYDRGVAKVRIEALREIPLLQKSNLKALKPPKPPEPRTELKPGQKSKAKEKSLLLKTVEKKTAIASPKPPAGSQTKKKASLQ